MLSLYAALSLTVLYRITINVPDLPYSPELKRPGSDDFLSTSKHIVDAVEKLLKPIPGDHRSSVLQFRYHQSIGTLAYLDVYSDKVDVHIKDAFNKAIRDGKLGKYSVTGDGFEFHVIKGVNSSCSPEEFQCLDRTCIPGHRRCDGSNDCPDNSDEHGKFASCKKHSPVIYQKQKIVTVPQGGIVHLSAVVDMKPTTHQVVWSHNGQIIGQGTLKTSDDSRISVYRNKDEYFLRIEHANDKDEGEYMMLIDGLGVEAKFHVRLSPDVIPTSSSGCPEGERACKSGHCLPVSQFCDRHSQCPDGDDEHNCTTVVCTHSEHRCTMDNVCVPNTVRCDGWKDCTDGTDEVGCQKVTPVVHPSKKSLSSRPTVSCPDGSAPEYSLHGSTYCWSNSVCPTTTDCIQGLCCPTGNRSSLRRCPTHRWECENGKCLDWNKRCNGRYDCRDGSDEFYCNGTDKRSVVHHGCQSNEFQCDSGECIPIEKKCDRKYECRDGTDEIKCEYFQSSMRAHNQQTQSNHIHEHHQPHHSGHPTHHTDERHREPEEDDDSDCNDQEFRCPYLIEAKCFHYDKLCDGVDDCGDGSDEVNCESGSREEGPLITEPQQPDHKGKCSGGQFQCHDSRCIDESLKCNRKYDCDDGSDETECEYYKSAMARRTNSVDDDQPQNTQQQDEMKRREEELRRREEEERRRESSESRREQEERRREEEERRREHEHRQRDSVVDRRGGDDDRRREEHQKRIEDELRRRQHEDRQRVEEERRRQEEERRRVEELRRTQAHAEHAQPKEVHFSGEHEADFKEDYEDSGCLEHEFMCNTGECIDKRRMCDTRIDCLDASDEENCPHSTRHEEPKNVIHPKFHISCLW